jgi:hypothetical protein
MLNMTAIGIYMILASITGTPTATQDMPVPNAQPQQLAEDKTKQSKQEAEKSVSTEAYIRNYFADLPIMIEVARCESQFRQTDSNGKVIRGKANRFDVGVMQINEHYHADTAKKLGYDIYSLEGNTSYARYLYDKYGIRPWIASTGCSTKSPSGLAMRTDDGDSATLE